MNQTIKIGDRLVGDGQPCFIIAEAGVNHNGDLDLALKLVEKAYKSGADAIKFQTFTPENVIIPNAPKAAYQASLTPQDESQYEMLKRLALSKENFETIKSYCDKLGLMFLSTPADFSDVDFLVDLGVSAIKIASMDIVNYPLLIYIAKQNKPIILSTGMTTLGEIEKAIDTINRISNMDVTLLQCVTNYPISYDQANLKVMQSLKQCFQKLVGFSDHTVGSVVSLAAVSLGACIIEKHFTLDTSLPGPDHSSSLDPKNFKQMVENIRIVEKALGDSVKYPLPIEIQNRQTMRRSLVASKDLLSGTILAPQHFAFKRPGTGLGTEFIDILVGRKLKSFIAKNTQFSFDHFMEEKNV